MVTWIKPTTGRGRHALSGGFMAVSKSKAKKGNSHQVVLMFYKTAMKVFRWFAGDMVLVGFDDGFMYVKRSSEGNYTLSPTGNNAKDSLGKCVSTTVRFTKPENFPFELVLFTSINEDEFTVLSDGTVMFAFPEEVTS